MKRRDLFATLGGLLLVAAVVVATFLYGNQQRQNQQAKEQQTKEQQAQQQSNEVAKSDEKPTAAQPAASDQSQSSAKDSTTGASPDSNTAPVAVGGGAGAETAQPATGATQQITPPGVTRTPEAGSALSTSLGTVALLTAATLYVRSRKSYISAR